MTNPNPNPRHKTTDKTQKTKDTKPKTQDTMKAYHNLRV